MRLARPGRNRDGDFLALAMVLAMTGYILAGRFIYAGEPPKSGEAPLARFVCVAEAGDILRLRDGRAATVTRRESSGTSELVFYRFAPQEREEAGSCKLIAKETVRVDFRTSMPGVR